LIGVGVGVGVGIVIVTVAIGVGLGVWAPVIFCAWEIGVPNFKRQINAHTTRRP
jgi:hypothetical protein